MDFRNELPTKKVKKVLTSRLLSISLLLATAALLAAALVGCGERSGNTQPGTTPATSITSAAAAEEPDAESVALYISNCSSCHAADGSGATGPAIGDGALNDKYTQAELEALIRDGVDSMAGLGDRLNSAEIATLAEYVRNDLNTSPAFAQTETETGTGTETADPPATDPPTDPPATDPPTAPPPADPPDPPALGPPPEAIEFADDWPLPNQNLAGTRTAVNSPINSSNVAKMEEAWRFYAPGGGFSGNIATTPLIVGDSVYFQDLQGVVYALDRETGKQLWTAGEQNAGVMFGPTGVAVGWGKVFAAKLGNRGRGQLVAAYDAAEGEELWATDVTSALGQAELNIQPFVYDGMVFASTSGFPAGVRGTIFALDQASGEVVWSFSTIEDEGLWGNPEINSGGGVWYPPALDVESGTLYFGVGSPYPFPGAPGFPAGSSRPGDNRWTSGTVALDVRTGEFRWGFQAFPHDLFDRDHVLAALAELNEGDGGDRRKVLVTAGKGNVVIGLDPPSGEELWSTSVGMHQNDELTSFDELIEVLPGAQGGIVTPIAVADGVAYVTAINAPTPYENDETPSGGEGTRLFTHPSNVVAIDVSDGSIIWDTLVDDKFIDLSIYQLDWLTATDVIGGATVVNDLLLTSTIFGRMLAIDRSTGELVIDFQADNGINGWPAVAGNLIVIPVGFADRNLGQTPHLLALRLPEQAGG